MAVQHYSRSARRLSRRDPTRTTTLRRWFAAQLKRRFARLKAQVHDLVAREDAFGLTTNAFCPGEYRDSSCSPKQARKELLKHWEKRPIEAASLDDPTPHVERVFSPDPGTGHEERRADAAALAEKLRAHADRLADATPKEAEELLGRPADSKELKKMRGKAADHVRETAKLADKLAVNAWRQFKGGWFVVNEFVEVPDVRQKDHYSCGAACAMSVGLHFGVGPKTLEAWKKFLGTDVEESTRPVAIMRTFSQFGCRVEAQHHMSVEDLAAYVEKGWPVVCPVQDYGPEVPSGAKFKYGHYLVVIGVGEGYVFCQDPSEDNVIAGEESVQSPGRVMIAQQDWARVWHDEDADGNKYVHFGIAVGPPPTRNAFCATGEGGGVDPTCSPTKIPEYVDKFGEKPLDSLHAEFRHGVYVRQRRAIEAYLRGDEPAASYTHGDYTAVTMRDGSGLYVKKGDPRPAPAGVHMGFWDPDLWEVAGVSEKQYKRMTYKDKLRADAKVQAVKYASSQFEKLKDVFWLQRNVHNRFQFQRSPAKVEEFQRWLRTQYGPILDEKLWRKYVEDGFKKGAGRAFDDTRKLPLPGAEERATKDEFLRSSFARPVSQEKVELLAGRAFDEIEGVTDRMSVKMSRVLTDGLVQGQSPREVAKDLADEVDIGKNEALRVARTEMTRVHAEGQLTALEDLGAEEVGVMVEWTSSGLGVTGLGHPSPCDQCEPLEGVVLTIDEARGLLPRHPN